MDNPDTLTPAESETSQPQSSAPAQEATATAEQTTSTEQTAQGDQTANTAAPDTKADGSLTNPQSETQQPEPKVDWEKRYRDLMSHTDKQVNTWQSRMQQQSQQMAEIQKWKAEQEQRAKSAALKPWSKAHPENSKFNGLLERAKVVQQQLGRIPGTLPPEQQQAMRDAIVSALSPEEQTQITEYRENLQNFQRDFFTDPQGTLLPMVEQLAEQKVQQVLQKIEAQQSVQRDFADPSIAPMVQKYGSEFSKALQDGVPYEYAKHMMGMFARMQELEAQAKGMAGKAAQADEQRRLAKGEASITRDPRTTAQDPYDLAKAEAIKKGISTGSKQFIDLLNKYTQK
jgi:hypothetical protein